MKLYYATGTCSFAPHVSLREAGIAFDLVRFDMKKGTIDGGAPIGDVNEKGYVPVLELDNGERLTEVSAVLQYIGDQKPESGIVPKAGTFERYRLIELLNFIGMEIHKIYWPIFHDGAEVEVTKAKEKLGRSFAFLQKQLGEKPFLMGEKFTVADAYLLTVLNWTKPGGIDMNQWPQLKSYWSRLRERTAVRAALEAEGMRPRT